MQPAKKLRVKKSRAVLFFPAANQLEQFRKRLQKFKPHDFATLVRQSRADGNTEAPGVALIDILRPENSRQLVQLLQAMGVDPTRPDAWQVGFFMLAHVHHSVGHLAWRPPKTNKNASKWRTEHDLVLINEMIRLSDRGFSERAALNELVSNRAKHKLFPYRAQMRPSSKLSATEQRFAALRARWGKIKRRKLADALGFYPPRGSLEEALASLGWLKTTDAVDTRNS